MTRVSGSWASAWTKSAVVRTASLPVLTTYRKPKPARWARAWVTVAIPPLWLIMEMPPGSSRSGSSSDEAKLAVIGSRVSMMPMQLGPQSWKPVSRHASTSACWRRRPLAAGLGEAPGPHDAAGDPGRGALAHHVHDRVGPDRDDRQVRRPRGGRRLREAREAGDGLPARVHRPDRARVAELPEKADGGPAEVPRLVGRADDRDRARREETREIREAGHRGPVLTCRRTSASASPGRPGCPPWRRR